MKLLTIVLPSLLLLCATSCVIGIDSNVRRTGKYVGPKTMEQITPGKSQEYVTALLGPPSSKTSAGDGTEIWSWTFSERKSTSAHLIFIFDSDTESHETGGAWVEFKDGRVVKSWLEKSSN
ncbi:MAG: outer membrane protein assembly factor BamE [Planctomycetota bacterium]|jgi:outer membrane protein assembly factor BamE (lipoprotein component of BamABCDE complex)|nr:outer membrane protein assembly factor BamE [Planctomycetota bacterium]MDP6940857.1 outer membrane protein assembly factor BamE [Planctomycetota bacterium]